MKCLWKGARSATLLVDDRTYYKLEPPCSILVNGEFATVARTAVVTLYGLIPATGYQVTAERPGEPLQALAFTTEPESATLNVLAFGAKGDGRADDTAAIQAALSSCPPNGRVWLPAGTYAVSPLFLKSHIRVQIDEGATLLLATDRDRFPILPPYGETEEGDPFVLGTWEGRPQPMYAALFTGVGVTDVVLYGRGLLDGQAQLADWWAEPKRMRGAWRGRMLYLAHCENVTVQGLTIQNSPSWNVHPYDSQNLHFLNLTVLAPADSPNTDGLDPESCRDVLIAGVRFSLGDDCIAVKAGKEGAEPAASPPCERVEICHCLMENGHGGVTVGSEMSGEVRHITVRRCLMRNTDRGLRIKTRRGRGGSVDNIAFTHVLMEHVGVPLAVNAFYHCDADGHAPSVQSRDPLPVTGGTPEVGTLAFTDVTVQACGVCACYALGLPESRIRALALTRVSVSYQKDASSFVPVMADGVPPCLNRGLIVENVEKLTLSDVRLQAQQGEPLTVANVGMVEGGVTA